MHDFNAGAAMVIAADLRTTFASVDSALASGARLLGTMLETAQTSNLTATERQRLLDNVTDGLRNVVKGRGDMVEAMKRMTVLKRGSNLETVDVGCDNPLPARKASEFFISADAANTAVAV